MPLNELVLSTNKDETTSVAHPSKRIYDAIDAESLGQLNEARSDGVSLSVPEQHRRDSATPLIYVILHSKYAIFHYFKSENLIDLEETDALGRTPLIAAGYAGEVGMIKGLLEDKSVEERRSLLTVCDEHGRTPLLAAAAKDKFYTVLFLLQNQQHYPVDIDACDKNKHDILSHSMLRLRQQIIPCDLMKFLTRDYRMSLFYPNKAGRIPIASLSYIKNDKSCNDFFVYLQSQLSMHPLVTECYEQARVVIRVCENQTTFIADEEGLSLFYANRVKDAIEKVRPELVQTLEASYVGGATNYQMNKS